jgi:hypothetical protein
MMTKQQEAWGTRALEGEHFLRGRRIGAGKTCSLFEIVNFHQPDSGAGKTAVQDRGVSARWEQDENSGFLLIRQGESQSLPSL